MKRYGRPQNNVTYWLRSDGAALNELGRGDDLKMGRWNFAGIFITVGFILLIGNLYEVSKL